MAAARPLRRFVDPENFEPRIPSLVHSLGWLTHRTQLRRTMLSPMLLRRMDFVPIASNGHARTIEVLHGEFRVARPNRETKKSIPRFASARPTVERERPGVAQFCGLSKSAELIPRT